MSVLNADSFKGWGFSCETLIPTDENNRFQSNPWPHVDHPAPAPFEGPTNIPV
jgi:hypothetical protein